MSIHEQVSEKEERATKGLAVPAETELENAASPISRRKLLASIGVTGMMLTAGTLLTGRLNHVHAKQSSVMGSVYGEGVLHLPKDTNLIIVTTISELRLLNAPIDQFLYFVADTGQEGHFYYDSADAASADNNGTIIVSSGGCRYKRVFQDELHVNWFGAKADYNPATDVGTPCDDALQAAIDALESYTLPTYSNGGYRGGVPKIVFGSGNYLLTGKKYLSDISVALRGLKISGRGPYSTNIFYKCDEAANGTDNYLFYNNNRLRDFSVEGINFTGVTGTERFLYYTSTGTASSTFFFDCTWNVFKIGIFFTGAANTSENRFHNCRIKAMPEGSIFYQCDNAQSVNHGFVNCDFEGIRGTALKFTKGGILNMIGGSMIPTERGVFLHIEDTAGTGVGAQNGIFNLFAVKPEIRDAAKFIFLKAHSADVNLSDCSMLVGHNFSTQEWASGTGYTVGSRCKLGGVYGRAYACIQAHTADSSNKPQSGAAWKTCWEPLYEMEIERGTVTVRGGRISYTTKVAYANASYSGPRPLLTFSDRCLLLKPVSDLVEFVPSDSITNSGSIPKVCATDCRSGIDFNPVDVTLNATNGFYHTTFQTHNVVFRSSPDQNGGLPSTADGTVSMKLPKGATILKVGFVSEGGNVNGVLNVTNYNDTVTFLSASNTGSAEGAGLWYRIDSEEKRTIRLSSTDTTRRKGFVHIQYV
ncbi:hypothetical protein FE783_14105 [Paenibacillus mesophilus]|uniref:hypothetical protein n=1 Tax=Paenibacillus mesophilus TaxID=2582849 RepID=UPI00110D5A98|nr:hypothetical protein [Paenibacillus mesophilus]TMV49624.1 hypothetical protein FE783_14105 [Paenibacillus mesophilus]